MQMPQLESGSFIYPYTEVSSNGVRCIVTASLLYDEVRYLDYGYEDGRLKPILRGVERDWDPERSKKCRDLLMSLERKSVLSGIQARAILSESEDENPRNRFCELVSNNFNLIQELGLPEDFHPGYQLNTMKLDECIAQVIGVRKKDLRKEEISVNYNQGESVLLAYAECVCNGMGYAPFALHQKHAATFGEVLERRLRRIRIEKKALEFTYFGNLLAAQFPVLKKPWEIHPSTIASLRRRTATLREKIHEGISKIFRDHLDRIERKGSLKFEDILEVKSDDEDALLNLIEEYRNSVGRDGLVGGRLFAAGSIATIGGGLVILPILGLPWIASLAFEFAKDAILYASDKLYKRRTEMAKPLQNAIMFIEELDKSL